MEWDETKHPRDDRGRFNGNGTEYRQNESYDKIVAQGNERQSETAEPRDAKKMTPAEKIASVHIDFDRDNILPELNDEDLEKVGAKKNKPVLLKKGVIDRNFVMHSDLTRQDFETIITKALYSPSDIFLANSEKPYFHFAKIIEFNSTGSQKIGLALLDVDEKKDNYEVVHAHFTEVARFEKKREKAKKKD